MSADLAIHLFEGISENDIAVMNKNTFGSKYFNPGKLGDEWDEAVEKIGNTDQIWVGEVSWLKAAVTGSDEFVPDPITAMVDIIGEDLLVIDDALIGKVRDAMGLENETRYKLANANEIVAWLDARRGKRIFTVSW